MHVRGRDFIGDLSRSNSIFGVIRYGVNLQNGDLLPAKCSYIVGPFNSGVSGSRIFAIRMVSAVRGKWS